MKIRLSELRRLIREAVRAEFVGRSPLDYHRSGNVQRLSLIDPESPEFAKGDVYFAGTKEYVHRGPSGRRLKKPKLRDVPGAEPGTLAFLDFHKEGSDYIYIDYMKTRQDSRGQGHARRLVDELVNKYGENATYDFGRILNPTMGKIQKELKARLEAAGGNVIGFHDY